MTEDLFALNGGDRLDEIAGAQVFRNKGEACVSFRILLYIRAVCWPAHLCIPPCPRIPVGVPFSETSKFMPIPPRLSQPLILSNDRRILYYLRPFRTAN